MKRILVIEDNPQNLYLVRFLLEGQGHQVLEAADGANGISIAQQKRPDLILVDIQLPKIDGYEVARRLKADPKTAPIPIVAVTSSLIDGDQERQREAGCLGAIQKPIDPKTFVGKIEQFL
ncbi:MAG TPA: response regulator [Methylomirabilota bacterium]|nr:response regulator [Methylomirabilota bacterium]